MSRFGWRHTRANRERDSDRGSTSGFGFGSGPGTGAGSDRFDFDASAQGDDEAHDVDAQIRKIDSFYLERSQTAALSAVGLSASGGPSAGAGAGVSSPSPLGAAVGTLSPFSPNDVFSFRNTAGVPAEAAAPEENPYASLLKSSYADMDALGSLSESYSYSGLQSPAYDYSSLESARDEFASLGAPRASASPNASAAAIMASRPASESVAGAWTREDTMSIVDEHSRSKLDAWNSRDFSSRLRNWGSLRRRPRRAATSYLTDDVDEQLVSRRDRVRSYELSRAEQDDASWHYSLKAVTQIDPSASPDQLTRTEATHILIVANGQPTEPNSNLNRAEQPIIIVTEENVGPPDQSICSNPSQDITVISSELSNTEQSEQEKSEDDVENAGVDSDFQEAPARDTEDTRPSALSLIVRTSGDEREDKENENKTKSSPTGLTRPLAVNVNDVQSEKEGVAQVSTGLESDSDRGLLQPAIASLANEQSDEEEAEGSEKLAFETPHGSPGPILPEPSEEHEPQVQVEGKSDSETSSSERDSESEVEAEKQQEMKQEDEENAVSDREKKREDGGDDTHDNSENSGEEEEDDNGDDYEKMEKSGEDEEIDKYKSKTMEEEEKEGDGDDDKSQNDDEVEERDEASSGQTDDEREALLLTEEQEKQVGERASNAGDSKEEGEAQSGSDSEAERSGTEEQSDSDSVSSEAEAPRAQPEQSLQVESSPKAPMQKEELEEANVEEEVGASSVTCAHDAERAGTPSESGESGTDSESDSDAEEHAEHTIEMAQEKIVEQQAPRADIENGLTTHGPAANGTALRDTLPDGDSSTEEDQDDAQEPEREGEGEDGMEEKRELVEESSHSETDSVESEPEKNTQQSTDTTQSQVIETTPDAKLCEQVGVPSQSPSAPAQTSTPSITPPMQRTGIFSKLRNLFGRSAPSQPQPQPEPEPTAAQGPEDEVASVPNPKAKPSDTRPMEPEGEGKAEAGLAVKAANATPEPLPDRPADTTTVNREARVSERSPAAIDELQKTFKSEEAELDTTIQSEQVALVAHIENDIIKHQQLEEVCESVANAAQRKDGNPTAEADGSNAVRRLSDSISSPANSLSFATPELLSPATHSPAALTPRASTPTEQSYGSITDAPADTELRTSQQTASDQIASLPVPHSQITPTAASPRLRPRRKRPTHSQRRARAKAAAARGQNPAAPPSRTLQFHAPLEDRALDSGAAVAVSDLGYIDPLEPRRPKLLPVEEPEPLRAVVYTGASNPSALADLLRKTGGRGSGAWAWASFGTSEISPANSDCAHSSRTLSHASLSTASFVQQCIQLDSGAAFEQLTLHETGCWDSQIQWGAVLAFTVLTATELSTRLRPLLVASAELSAIPSTRHVRLSLEPRFHLRRAFRVRSSACAPTAAEALASLLSSASASGPSGAVAASRSVSVPEKAAKRNLNAAVADPLHVPLVGHLCGARDGVSGRVVDLRRVLEGEAAAAPEGSKSLLNGAAQQEVSRTAEQREQSLVPQVPSSPSEHSNVQSGTLNNSKRRVTVAQTIEKPSANNGAPVQHTRPDVQSADLQSPATPTASTLPRSAARKSRVIPPSPLLRIDVDSQPIPATNGGAPGQNPRVQNDSPQTNSEQQQKRLKTPPPSPVPETRIMASPNSIAMKKFSYGIKMIQSTIPATKLTTGPQNFTGKPAIAGTNLPKVKTIAPTNVSSNTMARKIGTIQPPEVPVLSPGPSPAPTLTNGTPEKTNRSSIITTAAAGQTADSSKSKNTEIATSSSSQTVPSPPSFRESLSAPSPLPFRKLTLDERPVKDTSGTRQHVSSFSRQVTEAANRDSDAANTAERVRVSRPTTPRPASLTQQRPSAHALVVVAYEIEVAEPAAAESKSKSNQPAPPESDSRSKAIGVRADKEKKEIETPRSEPHDAVEQIRKSSQKPEFTDKEQTLLSSVPTEQSSTIHEMPAQAAVTSTEQKSIKLKEAQCSEDSVHRQLPEARPINSEAPQPQEDNMQPSNTNTAEQNELNRNSQRALELLNSLEKTINEMRNKSGPSLDRQSDSARPHSTAEESSRPKTLRDVENYTQSDSITVSSNSLPECPTDALPNSTNSTESITHTDAQEHPLLPLPSASRLVMHAASDAHVLDILASWNEQHAGTSKSAAEWSSAGVGSDLDAWHELGYVPFVETRRARLTEQEEDWRSGLTAHECPMPKIRK